MSTHTSSCMQVDNIHTPVEPQHQTRPSGSPIDWSSMRHCPRLSGTRGGCSEIGRDVGRLLLVGYRSWNMSMAAHCSCCSQGNSDAVCCRISPMTFFRCHASRFPICSSASGSSGIQGSMGHSVRTLGMVLRMKRPSCFVTSSPCDMWRGSECDAWQSWWGWWVSWGILCGTCFVWLAWQELWLLRIRVRLHEVCAVSDVDVMVLWQVFVVPVNPVALVCEALEIFVEVTFVQLPPVQILPLPCELSDALLRLDGTLDDVVHIPW
jgi:hypothetical protein